MEVCLKGEKRKMLEIVTCELCLLNAVISAPLLEDGENNLQIHFLLKPWGARPGGQVFMGKQTHENVVKLRPDARWRPLCVE